MKSSMEHHPVLIIGFFFIFDLNFAAATYGVRKVAEVSPSKHDFRILRGKKRKKILLIF